METIDELRRQNAELTAEVERLRELSLHTERVTNAFQESQSRFRAVFEASRLGNKIIASDLKILQVNAALVKLLGYSEKEDILGKAILDYSPPERHDEWRHLQQQLWTHLAPSFSLETTLIRKDGSIIWCQVTSILFNDNGQTLGYTIIEDITEQYKLRQLKEEFISVASHELNTPVTSLMANMQLLNRIMDREECTSEQVRRLTRNAEKSAIKLGRLLTDLLNTTKIEQGQLALNRTTFPVAELAEACSNHVQQQGVYSLIVEGDQSLMVFADQYKIEQVLINLVNNAIKYAPKSLTITLKVEQIPSAIKFTIIDYGLGIEKTHQAKLFDRYFRLDRNEDSISGLGLGLYISAEIIKRHQGEIGVESEHGKGAAFWFILPEQEIA
jgi:PAS domain S-box-containing protein